MNKVDIAGLKVDEITKNDLLNAIVRRIKLGQKTFITTLYSEFLYRALRDSSLLEFLNKADFAVADGIGIFWAKKYLSLPLTAKKYWLKILQALWQIKYSLAAIIFNRRWILNALPEKIPGSELVWDLAELAAKNNLSIYLLGGFGDTPQMTANKLLNKSANKLKIAGWTNKNPGDPTVIKDINQAAPDILMVAYGPITQEKWIAENLPQLNVKLAVGVGGSFDYIAGKKIVPPRLIRNIGLEWLWRLFTQPHRIKRIWQATFGLMIMLLKYKFFNSFGFRKNVVSVILDSNNQILIGKRSPRDKYLKDVGEYEKVKFQNYWQLPQGGVDGQEDIVTAAKRETFEELGIKNISHFKTSPKKNYYSWNTPLRPLWFNRYHYVGQEQSIVYFKFRGLNADIKVDNDEFENFQWVNINDLAKKIHNERLALARIIQEDLRDLV